LHACGDLIILSLCYILGHFFAFGEINHLFESKYIQLWIYLNIIYIFAAKLSGTFDMYRNTRFVTILMMLVKLFFFQVVLSFSYIVVFKDFNETFKISREVLLYTFAGTFTFTTIWRFGLIKIVRFYRSKGVNNRKAIIIGAGPMGQDFRKMLQNKVEYGIHFLGFFDDEPDRFPEVREYILGNVESSKQFAANNEVDEIFCALPYKQEDKIKDIIHFADEHLIRLKIVPDLSRFLTHQLHKIEVDYYGIFPVMTLRSEPLENAINRVAKRAFDFGFSLLVFITVLWWLIPLVALIIKVTSRGPVFFVQDRSGMRNKPFKVYKFRTMYINGEAHHKQASKDDPRITPVGRILRKTNLDELPQFINVLLGHMSVIGPRPHMLKHTEEYSKIIDKFMVRHFVKPGITGWAQVNGYRGETKNPEEMEMRVQADLWYIENWSFVLDLRIVFMTVFNMIRGEEKAY
jgi:Undecaprenyl-phosphate glucose phosphotransferase